jgi:hypothetical protein
MNVQEFKEKYIDEDGWVETGGDVSVVEIGDSIVEHKQVYSTNVYAVGDEYFAVDYTRDNTGYWSDGGSDYEAYVRKVIPTIIAKTAWVDVIENS